MKLSELIKNNNYIVVASGAGISTNPGIPDYRSDDGLYTNGKSEEIFSYVHFLKNPTDFYRSQKTLISKDFIPSFTHAFIKTLELKNKLCRHYTQNIDGLSHKLDETRLVEVHGNMHKAACSLCHLPMPIEHYNAFIYHDIIPYCTSLQCGGFVKPNIVMYGQSVDFGNDLESDELVCDLLIIIGTSLQVYPFASIQDKMRCPRVIITKDWQFQTSGFAHSGGKPNHLWWDAEEVYPSEEYERTVVGDCDEILQEVATELEWYDEIVEMQSRYIHKVIDYTLPLRSEYIKFDDFDEEYQRKELIASGKYLEGLLDISSEHPELLDNIPEGTVLDGSNFYEQILDAVFNSTNFSFEDLEATLNELN